MKKNIIFGLFNVLIDKENNKKTYLFDYLKPLANFCEKNNKNMFLVTGLKESEANEIVKQYNLEDFFKKENIINITEKYQESLGDLDKQMKQQKYDKDRYYVDEYFKVFYFKNQFLEEISDSLYVGSDIWTDGYYLKRYVEMDFVLIEDYLKNNNKQIQKEAFSEIHILNPSFEDLKKYLTEEKEFKYEQLEKYAQKYLHSEMFGNKFSLFSKKQIKDLIKKRKR